MREKETMQISFPDIEPDTWEKIMVFLEPTSSIANLPKFKDLLELIPFYDKYE